MVPQRSLYCDTYILQLSSKANRHLFGLSGFASRSSCTISPDKLIDPCFYTSPVGNAINFATAHNFPNYQSNTNSITQLTNTCAGTVNHQLLWDISTIHIAPMFIEPGFWPGQLLKLERGTCRLMSFLSCFPNSKQMSTASLTPQPIFALLFSYVPPRCQGRCKCSETVSRTYQGRPTFRISSWMPKLSPPNSLLPHVTTDLSARIAAKANSVP